MKTIIAILLSPLFIFLGVILCLSALLAIAIHPGTWKDGVWTRTKP